MALKLRLARGGTKKRPHYSIVVADSRSPRDGRFIEKLGTYDPLLARDAENRVVLDQERVSHWMSVGARPTDRVARFLDAAGMVKRDARNNPNKAKPGKKAQERLEALRQAEEDAKAAAEAAAVEAAAPAEAPAEAEAPEAPEAPAEGTGGEAAGA